MNTKKLTVIVPFYNEESTLSNAVIDLINNLNDFELILVNDGSTDSSLEKAKVLQNQYPFIKIISNGKNHEKELL